MGVAPSHNNTANADVGHGAPNSAVGAVAVTTINSNVNAKHTNLESSLDTCNDNVGAQAYIENNSGVSISEAANAEGDQEKQDENGKSHIVGKENDKTTNCSASTTRNNSHNWRKGFGNGISSKLKQCGNGNNNSESTTSCESASTSTTGSATNSSSGPSVWCLVKSRTRQHHSSKEVKKSVWFEARDRNAFTIGRDSCCDLYLDDDRCDLLNARIIPSLNQSTGKWGIFLHPDARMYRLIGMLGKSSPPEVLQKGSVIKVGSISLEVIDFCTDDAHDFAEQFALEIEKGYSSKKKSSSKLLENDLDNDKDVIKETKDDSGSCDSECTLERDSSPESLPCPNSTRNLCHVNPEKSGHDESNKQATDQDDTDDADEAICYICWGGIEQEASDNEEQEPLQTLQTDLTQQESEKKEGSDSESQVKKKLREDKAQNMNPMIKNPCGNCSGCSKYVHLQCLLTWIKKSGSGHCTICNGVLPSHFASSPPNMELKIVRHRRGHSWVGTRRFRLSFADTSRRFIGNSSRADVRLPDRSVSEQHAVIKFDRKKKQFFLSDNHSKGGTYLQLTEPLQLLEIPSSPAQTQQLSEFKIGRTSLSIKFSSKKTNMMLNMIGWGRNIK